MQKTKILQERDCKIGWGTGLNLQWRHFDFTGERKQVERANR